MLARYFGGALATGVVYKGVVEDRQIVGMPLYVNGGSYIGAGDVGDGDGGLSTSMPLRVNSRRIANQVYHQIRAGMVVELDQSTLGNFEFLRARGIVSDGGLAALRRECGDAKVMLEELRRLERSQPELSALLGHAPSNRGAIAAFVRYINENLHLAMLAQSFDFACNALTWAADDSVVYQRAHEHLSRHVAFHANESTDRSGNATISNNSDTTDLISRTLVALPGWKKSGQLRPKLTLPKARGQV
eukprot:1576959-Rhodomonas_salina.1